MVHLVGNTDSKTDLFCRAREGDEAALAMLLADAATSLRARLVQMIPEEVKSTCDVDDLLQLVHSAAYRCVGDLPQRGKTTFYRWQKSIALDELRRYLASKGSPRRASSIEHVNIPGNNPPPSLVTPEERAELEAALKKLPENYRHAIHLVHLEGLTVAQAAAAMGRTDRELDDLLFKAMEVLRNLVKVPAAYQSTQPEP